MNSDMMEELLNEEEGSTLDFKRDQYPFQTATDEQKCELLKDILAFANAWRRTDAFILIGTKEVKGGRNNVVGVTTHFDDASIQQFVNGKTNRPISFSYEVFPYEGVHIDIIHIPLQERPIYLKNNFGKLKQNAVYIRRGSSTEIASPDEVARMGEIKVQETLGGLREPSLNDRKLQALRRDLKEKNIVIVEKMRRDYGSFRLQCRVTQIDELYVIFSEVQNPQNQVSGAIDKITIEYEPTMKMKLVTIARI